LKTPFAGIGIPRSAAAWRRRIPAISIPLLLALGGWCLGGEGAAPPTQSRFTMGRMRFTTPDFGWFGRQGPPWSHDWPRSEEHLMKIMAEVTRLDANPGGRIISFENEEVFRYPIAYMCEVGFLQLSDEEATNMREYLLRGGFLIVDDFRGDREMENFRREMQKVFPDRWLEELPRSHPIWTCFYDISGVFPQAPYARSLTPRYLGMADDRGRLMMIVDYNMDLSEYWEWSGNPFMPVDQSNEAFKYGVNYLMYALSH
jgi:hypothetical protein